MELAAAAVPPVARSFDPPSEPWLAGHRGVDLRGRPGQPVLSPAAGTVRYAAVLAGRGVVVVEAGGLRLTFEPVDAVVSIGDEVRAGEVIGHLMSTHSHCLPSTCLHWGVKRGQAYLDPLRFVGDAEIVLLPFGDVRPADGSWAAPDAELDAPPASGGWVSGVPPGGSGAASVAVQFALGQLGDPYVWAAEGPDTWDCSGLTMAAWGAAGRALPHYSAAQYLATTPIARDQLRPGDLVFWAESGAPPGIYHVALYLGDGQVVHAPRPGEVVRIESMTSWDEPDYFSRV
ncbi:MAG: peptidoglycan DD-metalloendopeptidase family protein [Propionibacteriales bacterium]|nr:peptidoglycan DD-metalloendopeptidase family protein [Propionibacteriales bacterium]